MPPAKPRSCFRRITDEEINLGRTEVARINFDQDLAGCGVIAFFIDTFAAPQGLVRLCRLGATFLTYQEPSTAGPWVLHRTFVRPDLPPTLHVGVLFDFFDLSFELVVSHFTSFNPSMTTRATVGMISRSVEWSLVNIASTNFPPSGISMYATS